MPSNTMDKLHKILERPEPVAALAYGPDIRRNVLSAHIVQARSNPTALALEIGVHSNTLRRFLEERNTGIGAKAAVRVDAWMQARGYYVPGRITEKAVALLARYSGHVD